ncbi:Gtr1/RagA G protein conserved region [Popillia japonica]|uniref:Gtr1/RagA G protein conserved region n=1 Tax=Popillia japonica TaxID=7064 RepID=A0AAW1N4E7_POPJA
MSYQDDEEGVGYGGHVGSFPKEFGYGGYDGEHDITITSTSDQKPRILLMGLRRSGKSSIQKFQIWDFPGQIDFFDPTFDSDTIFGGCGALVFVIDAQDDYIEALHKLNLTVTKAYKVNPKIIFEVFIHKVDGLGDDCKMETQRDIHQRANDELNDAGYDQIHLSLHLTSIYDHSIFEAFSKVVQKLIPQLPALENLLNILNTNSAIEKSFLFDVVSKIYIATDSTPVDMQSYELCCDMIDVVIDVSWIYGIKEDQDAAAFDDQSSSLIKLNNGTVLYLREVYLREVNKFLALVCILREDNFDHKGIIDYNFLCFREAIQQVFELRNKLQHSSTTNSVGSPMVNGKNSLGDGHLSPTLTDENN